MGPDRMTRLDTICYLGFPRIVGFLRGADADFRHLSSPLGRRCRAFSKFVRVSGARFLCQKSGGLIGMSPRVRDSGKMTLDQSICAVISANSDQRNWHSELVALLRLASAVLPSRVAAPDEVTNETKSGAGRCRCLSHPQPSGH